MTSQMPPLILAEPDQPFWGFAELLLATAILLAALGGVVGFASRYLHAPLESGLWSVIEEGAAYAILFLALKLMFARYGKGVLDSLGWTKPIPFSPLSLAITGFSLSLIVVVLQYALRTPNVSTPFEKLLEDPASRIAVAVFGITLGPMVEELLFRGFLQPVLVSSLGVLPGILATSALFGALHLLQNANIWQSGVLIMIVGFVLGTIRHLTGSTKASTIVHIAYNSLPFLALVADSASFTHK
jgi:membrane protease YdiL (CAAX protease family)